MTLLPLCFDLRDRACLVVGGGDAAAAKVRLLRGAGAAVTVVARGLGEELAGLAGRSGVDLARRSFAPADVTGKTLVVSASGDPATDENVSEAARAAGIPVNVVDRPDLSTFAMPAIIDRDPLLVAVSTGGASPALARAVRGRIERLLPARIGKLARFAQSFCDTVRSMISDATQRRTFWERVFDGPVAEAVLRGDGCGAREMMLALVNEARPAKPRGIVHIVGAGPGDPDLLTLRALQLLQQADVIVYDRLVGPEILTRARREAQRVFVGKAKGAHGCRQDEIQALLLRQARQGKRVVRLKGGDPFVFGRGGEERAYLLRHGIEVEVVPGITAALGCGAVAGIPLTHRGVARTVTVVSGHARDGAPDLDWQALARLDGTLVIYMGVTAAAIIARRLIENGLDSATPTAVIQDGTRPTQKIVTGRLATLDALVRDNDVRAPALIVIGEVVREGASATAEPAFTAAMADSTAAEWAYPVAMAGACG